jgi:hypothetical protein
MHVGRVLIVVTVAVQSIVDVRSAAVIPLTALDYRAIERLYGRALHEAGAASGLRQWLTNLVIEPVPDGAMAWPYIVQGRGVEMTSAALYRDRLAKGRDGWRLGRREEFPGTAMPAREHYPAPSNESARTFTARDYAEVKRILARYNLGYDNAGPFDGGLLTSLSFTPNGVFQPFSGPAREGRTGVIAQVTEAQTTPGLHHWDSNVRIDMSPNGEVSSVNYDLTFTVTDDGRHFSLSNTRLLTHRFVRSAEGWLVEYRRADPPGAVSEIHWPALSYGVTARAIALEAGERRRRETLSSADYVEIDQLYARSSFAFDSGANHGLDFAGTFALDGSVVRDDVRTTGRRALAELAATNQPALHTWISNLVIEPAGDGAAGRAYVLEVALGATPSVTGIGHFDDVLVTTGDGWRFKSRTYTSDADRPVDQSR